MDIFVVWLLEYVIMVNMIVFSPMRALSLSPSRRRLRGEKPPEAAKLRAGKNDGLGEGEEIYGDLYGLVR